jgi:hypothetical protein
MSALPAALPKAKSSFVRRLIAATNDPAKQRIRAWLAALDDERLSGFGLTPEDIAILRGTQHGARAEAHHSSADNRGTRSPSMLMSAPQRFAFAGLPRSNPSPLRLKCAVNRLTAQNAFEMEPLTYHDVHCNAESLEKLMREARRQRALVIHELFVAAINVVRRRLERIAQNARSYSAYLSRDI